MKNGGSIASSTRKMLATLAALAALSGCAGFGKHETTAAVAAAPAIDGVAVVVARLSPEAARQHAELPQFSRDELAAALRRRLQGKGLVAPTANHKVDILVTDVQLRTGMAAAVPGVTGWDDHVHGTVRVMDAGGRTLHSFEIKASTAYMLSGRDSPRVGWLVDRYAELASAELEKVIGAPPAASTARR